MPSYDLIKEEILKKGKTFRIILFYIIFLSIMCLQIYSIFFIFPVEKRLFEECNKKILCEEGYLPNRMCYGYIWNPPGDNITVNITI